MHLIVHRVVQRGRRYPKRMHEVNCDTLEEVFRELDPRPRMVDGHRVLGEWLYRGVSNAEYELVPTALRRDQVARLASQADELPAESQVMQKDQIRREALVAQRFWVKADRMGLQLPEGDGHLRTCLETRRAAKAYSEGREEPWPPKQMLPLLAIMQHYGLSTRLLDWSRDPFVGLFFATGYPYMEFRDRVIGKSDVNLSMEMSAWRNGKFAVYVLDASLLDEVQSERPPAEQLLRIVTAPAAGNPNLLAQRGAFTVMREVRTIEPLAVDRRPFEQLAEEVYPELAEKRPPWIRKVVASRDLVEDVILNLRAMGYNFSGLFPGFDGVAKGIR